MVGGSLARWSDGFIDFSWGFACSVTDLCKVHPLEQGRIALLERPFMDGMADKDL